MSERSILSRLCQRPATMPMLATELSLGEAAVRAGIVALREAGAPIVEIEGVGFALSEPLQLLDAEKILGALDPACRTQVHSISVAFDTASTQADALAAVAPENGCAVFLAERQSAGQGRRGRVWASPVAANLYMSVSRRFACGVSALSGLSLVVGVAVAEALNRRLAEAGEACADDAARDPSGAMRIGVKWPNDLVADGKKLGGILIQLRTEPGDSVLAVIGIGINVRMPASHGALIDQAWCDLQALGIGDASRNQLAAALLDDLLPALAQFEQAGLSPFLPRWQRLDALAGKPVRILDGQAVHQGTSLGIADSGALRVRQDGRERLFHGGEVSVRPV